MKPSTRQLVLGVLCAVGALGAFMLLLVTGSWLALVSGVGLAAAGYSTIWGANELHRAELRPSADTQRLELDELVAALKAASEKTLDDETLQAMAANLASRPLAPLSPRAPVAVVQPPPAPSLPPWPCYRCGKPARHRVMYRERTKSFPRYDKDAVDPVRQIWQWDHALCDFHYEGLLQLSDAVVLNHQPLPDVVDPNVVQPDPSL